jgi:hypothetical protein
MKVGAENKSKTLFAIAIMVAAVLFLAWRLKPSAPVADAADTNAQGMQAQAQRTVSAGQRVAPAAVLKATLDPRLRTDLLKYSEETEYAGTGRNIFREQSEPVIEKPVAAPCKTKDCKPVTKTAEWTPPGPPAPPPINLKFYGWASKPGEAKQIFLSQGGDVFVAGEGDIIARRYRIVKITNTSVEIEDVLSNNRQTISLTQG